MKLLNVECENFKRIQVVEFSPGDGATLIAGENAQGKSSILDAVETTLRGAKAIPSEPVRRGAKKSRTKLTMGEGGVPELIAERTINAVGGTTSLVVTDGNGVEQKSPQGLLEKLYSTVAFDPLEFAREKPEVQDATLKKLIGLDFSELDADRANIYAERTAKNRDVAQAKARAAGMPKHSGVPLEEVSVKAVAEQLAAARAHEQARHSAEERLTRQQADVDRAMAYVENLKAQLRTAEDKYREEVGLLDGHRKDLEAMAPVGDTGPLEEKLATAEETNKRVRDNAARKAEERRAEQLEAAADELTERIKDIDAAKAAQIAAAKFPVEGLGFGNVGVTLNGLPLDQASSAEKYDLSLEIGIAQNPHLKLLLIRDGSLLDDATLRRFHDRATEKGYQLLIERVGTKDGGAAIIIEEGLIKTATAAE